AGGGGLAGAGVARPVAGGSRREVVAVCVLVGERAVGGRDGRRAGWLAEPSRAALAQVPDAARWAAGFAGDRPVSAQAFRHRSAPFTVHTAAEAIAQACIPQPDQMLRDLLIAAIDACTARAAREPAPAPDTPPPHP